MSEKDEPQGLIHTKRKIVIPDVPTPSPIDWISQVINNINSQILSVDVELVNANAIDINQVI